MLTRRKFLAGKSLFFTIALGTPAVKSLHMLFSGVDLGPVLVAVRTDFPRELTLQEFERDQSKFVNDGSFKGMLQSMISQGKIISAEKMEFQPTHFTWWMEFKDHHSYSEWCDFVAENRLVNEDVFKSLGYNVSVSLSRA